MNDSLKADSSSAHTADLYRWLGYGAWGAVLSGLLVASASALSLASGPHDGLTVVELLYFAALFAAVLVLGSFWHLSLHVQSPGLRKSALGLFGTLIILEVAALNVTEGAYRWWNVVLWIALILATILLGIVIWHLEDIEKEVDGESAGKAAESKGESTAAAPPPSPPVEKAEHGPSIGGAGKVIAGLSAVGLFVLKVSVKAGVRGLAKSLDMSLFEALVILLLLGLYLGFLVWFAVTKVRLRKLLGPLAGWLGGAELLLILLAVLAVGGMFVEMFQVAVQDGLDEKAIDGRIDEVGNVWLRRLDMGTIAASALLSALTAGLFLSYRRRLTASHP